MSEQPTQPNPASTIASAYVREMLDLNPMWQSSQIIRRRRELWSGGGIGNASFETADARTTTAVVSRSSNTTVDPEVQRRLETRARQYLETVQSQFYQLPQEKLQQYLRFLQNEKLPEFTAKAKRLSEVARCRETLLKIHAELQDEKFTYSLMQCLICPSAQAGALKEQYIEAIIAEKRVSQSCEMVKAITGRYPEIYQLERDWFNLFLSTQNQKQWAAGRTVQTLTNGSNRIPKVFVIIVVVLMVVSKIAISLNRVKSNSWNSRQSVPTFQVPPMRNPTASAFPQSEHDPSAGQTDSNILDQERIKREQEYRKRQQEILRPSTIPVPYPASPILPSNGYLPDNRPGRPLTPRSELIEDPLAQYMERLERARARQDQITDQIRNGELPSYMPPNYNPPSYRPPSYNSPSYSPPNFNAPRSPSVPSEPEHDPSKPFRRRDSRQRYENNSP